MSIKSWIKIIKFTIFVVSLLLLIFTVVDKLHAEILTFQREYNYQASEIDSMVSSRAIALEQVKRQLLEELGTYLESKTEIINYHLNPACHSQKSE